jgi:hypothetical protein
MPVRGTNHGSGKVTMKKTTQKLAKRSPLLLSTEKVRELDGNQLRSVVGGESHNCVHENVSIVVVGG